MVSGAGMFLTSLITPLILLVLSSTFLANVYEDSFRSALEAAGASVPDKVLWGCVGGELVSSLLAVSCVTVGNMYAVLIAAIVIAIALYVGMNG